MGGKLKDAIEYAENYAFNHLAKNQSSWCLHSSEQNTAIRIYTAPEGKKIETRGVRNSTITYSGKGNIDENVRFPQPKLDEGFFRGQ